MERFIRVLAALGIVLFLVFMYFLLTSGMGCRSEEEKYFQLRYPECKIDVVDRSNLKTKVRIDCPGKEPEIVTIRSK